MNDERVYRRRMGVWLVALASAVTLAATGCGDDNNNGKRDGGRTDAGDAGDVGDVGDAGPMDAGDAGPMDAGDTGPGGPGALLQVIHESPDPAAQMVDVYVNGELFIDDFTYRTATPFTQVPAGVDLSIQVAPSDSTSAADSIATLGPINLNQGGSYVGIVNGLVDPSVVPGADLGSSAALNLAVLDNARTQSSGDQMNEAVWFNAVADAGAVDISADRGAEVIDKIAYGQFSDYGSLSDGIHPLDILRSTSQRRLDSFQTRDLSGGPPVVAVVSGVLTDDPALPDFRIYTYGPDGGPGTRLLQAGRLQVMHNSPDPALSAVDVYVDGEKIADNVTFQQATPFLSFPSEMPLEIALAPGDSSSANDAVKTFDRTLGEGGSYLAPAIGYLNPSDQAMRLRLPTGITRELALQGDKVEFKAFHGVPDAPPIDIVTAAGKVTLVDDLAYSQFSQFVSVDPGNYILNVTTADQSQTLQTLPVDLSQAGGSAFNLVASGLLDPPAGGPSFAILQVLPDGTVTVLKPSP